MSPVRFTASNPALCTQNYPEGTWMLSWNQSGGHVEVQRNVRSLTMHDTCYVVKAETSGGTFHREAWISASFTPDAAWLEIYGKPYPAVEARTTKPTRVMHYGIPYQVRSGLPIEVRCMHPDVGWAMVEVPGIGTVPMCRTDFEVLTDVAKYALIQ